MGDNKFTREFYLPQKDNRNRRSRYVLLVPFYNNLSLFF